MPNDQDNLVEPSDDSLEAPGLGSVTPQTPVSPPSFPNKKPGLVQRLKTTTNVYLLVFVLLIMLVSAVIYITIRSSNPSSKVTSSGSLTQQQLAALKGNTTLVGDSKQTLDVQSNAIFEGQVLVRSDLNVAGTIKVGGGLALSSITIGGAGNFGQLAVNGGLNVGGDTILQGQLTVQKGLTVGGNASFGSLSVSQMTVTNLQLKGDLQINKHITTSGGTPSKSNGTALGSGGTASLNGSDTAGTININTGGGPGAGCFITVNFNQRFGATPHVIISPSNSSAAALQYYSNRSSTSFSVCTANPPSGGTNYVFDYAVFG